MMAGNWLALRTVGVFRRGREYSSAELGVLGRMAVKCGHLVPVEEQPEIAVKPRTARKPRATKGVGDGQQGDVQAGSGEGVRDGDGS